MLRNHRARPEVVAVRLLPTAMVYRRPTAGGHRRTIVRRDHRKRRFGLGEIRITVTAVPPWTHPALHSGAQIDGRAETRNRPSLMLTRL